MIRGKRKKISAVEQKWPNDWTVKKVLDRCSSFLLSKKLILHSKTKLLLVNVKNYTKKQRNGRAHIPICSIMEILLEKSWFVNRGRPMLISKMYRFRVWSEKNYTPRFGFWKLNMAFLQFLPIFCPILAYLNIWWFF